MEPESHPGPPAPEPRNGPSRGATIGIILALTLSLSANVLLGQRSFDERATSDRLQAQIDQQKKELELLRTKARGSESDDPLTRIAKAVEQLRKLTFKHEVDAEVMTAAALRKRVHDEYVKEVKRSEIETTADVLKLFGLLPQEMNLYDSLLDLQEEQVAGFYDHETKQMVVGAADATTPSPLTRVLLAHEYTHALTDQYFPLKRLDQLQDDGKGDAAAAFQALVEGDATYLMAVYRQEVLTAAEQDKARDEQSAIPQSLFTSAPPFLQNELLFPYNEGVLFVSALQESAGWEAVDAAYRDPPTSTEQILHPGKYLSSVRDEPTSLSLPDLTMTLDGYTVAERSEMGEYDVRETLDLGGDQGIAQSDARTAAAGWDGGRYVALRSGGSMVVALMTAWDSSQEASQAFRAIGRWLPLRFHNRGSSFAPGGSARGWSAPDGAGLVSRSGNKVLWIMGSSRDPAEKALRGFPGF